MLAELFQTTKQNISLHIQNIYEENELLPEATVKKYLTVQTEGGRNVERLIDYYNLDMIISVGYRIKSSIATHFRQWATQRLREYIISIKFYNYFIDFNFNNFCRLQYETNRFFFNLKICYVKPKYY